MMTVSTRFNTNRVTGAAKVTAFFNGKQASTSYDYAYNIRPNHFKAAMKVLRKVDADLQLSANNVKSTKTGYIFQVKIKK